MWLSRVCALRTLLCLVAEAMSWLRFPGDVLGLLCELSWCWDSSEERWMCCWWHGHQAPSATDCVEAPERQWPSAGDHLKEPCQLFLLFLLCQKNPQPNNKTNQQTTKKASKTNKPKPKNPHQNQASTKMKQWSLNLHFSRCICSSQCVSIGYNTSLCILKLPILGDLRVILLLII